MRKLLLSLGVAGTLVFAGAATANAAVMSDASSLDITGTQVPYSTATATAAPAADTTAPTAAPTDTTAPVDATQPTAGPTTAPSTPSGSTGSTAAPVAPADPTPAPTTPPAPVFVKAPMPTDKAAVGECPSTFERALSCYLYDSASNSWSLICSASHMRPLEKWFSVLPIRPLTTAEALNICGG